MGKQPQHHPFENNPFLEGFSEWMDSPEGELSREVSDTVCELLDTAGVDARKREIIWDDGKALDIDQCVERIHRLFPDFPLQLIETHVLSWLECGFVSAGLLPGAVEAVGRADRALAQGLPPPTPEAMITGQNSVLSSIDFI